MPHTLVTGANSYVAAHIIDQLVQKGHTVTGSVRRQAAGDVVLKEHPEWVGKLDFVEIKDYADQGVWVPVFKKRQIDHIVHVAAPLLDNPENTDYDLHYLRPSVEGNLSLLRSAQLYAPNLKSIAVTGSVNAITTGDDLTTRTLTNTSWNSITKEQAREQNNAYTSYCSSKKEAELAIWDFVETQKPSFSITVFLPGLIFGPPIQPIKSVKSLNFSVGVFYSLFSGENAGKKVPGTMFPTYIDVRDLAAAHVKALTTPGAANKRFLIGGMPYSNTDAVHVLGANLPELGERLPTEDEENVVVPKIEAEEGNRVIGITFRSGVETFVDMAKKVLEIEKRG